MSRRNISDLNLPRARQGNKAEGLIRYEELSGLPDSEGNIRLLLTEKGEKTIYELACACNRCNACAAVCPAYAAIRKENISPRGRIQLIRLLNECRLEAEALKETLATCFLCGRCSKICKAAIPIPEIVLELRKQYLPAKAGILRRLSLWLKLKHKLCYELWLKLGFLLLKLKLKLPAKIIGLPALLGRTNSEFFALKLSPPLTFAEGRLKNTKLHGRGLKWVYFSSCEINYLMPNIAQASVALLERHLGEGLLFNNQCCGFVSYRYGNIKQAREFAKQNIIKFEHLSRKYGKFIIITDCSACAAFLKNYEQLFIREKSAEAILEEISEEVRILGPGSEKNKPESHSEDAAQNEADLAEASWRRRARLFSAAVRDISELFKPADFKNLKNYLDGKGKNICWQDACMGRYGQGIYEPPRMVLSHICGSAFKHLPNSGNCCGGQYANLPLPKKLSAHAGKNKARDIASIQADLVLTSAPCCLLALKTILPAFYPNARACHISVFLDKLEKHYKELN